MCSLIQASQTTRPSVCDLQRLIMDTRAKSYVDALESGDPSLVSLEVTGTSTGSYY